jgi:hypothetical protein
MKPRRKSAQSAYEELVSPSQAIAMGRPRGRDVTLDAHIRSLITTVAIMESVARDDERFALACVARAAESDDAAEADTLLDNALRNGAWSVERDFCRAHLLAFIAGLRCAQQMSAPRKSPRRKLARKTTKPRRRVRGGAR